MKNRTGIALSVLALIAGGALCAPALAEDRAADDLRSTTAFEAEWEQNLQARLDLDAQTIAADAMSAATELELSKRLDLEPASFLLALATKR